MGFDVKTTNHTANCLGCKTTVPKDKTRLRLSLNKGHTYSVSKSLCIPCLAKAVVEGKATAELLSAIITLYREGEAKLTGISNCVNYNNGQTTVFFKLDGEAISMQAHMMDEEELHEDDEPHESPEDHICPNNIPEDF